MTRVRYYVERTMRSGTTTDSKIQKPSLTDSILKLCASGQFGVREAIAAATDQQQPPSSHEEPAKPARTQESKDAQRS